MSTGNRQGAAPAQKALHPHFFAKYTVLRQENSKEFDRLLQALQETYTPSTPMEDLAVMRLAQAHWRLRRIDTMEAAVYESHVEKVRERAPNAHPAAVLAAEYLSLETPTLEQFTKRIQRQREDHERQITRVSQHLMNLQKQRAQTETKGKGGRKQEARRSRTPSGAASKSSLLNERASMSDEVLVADAAQSPEAL